jgi:hypothetical protein
MQNNMANDREEALVDQWVMNAVPNKKWTAVNGTDRQEEPKNGQQ